MPHLDANALIDDPEGLNFLRDVLDGPIDVHPARRAMATVRTTKRKKVLAKLEGDVERPRRKRPVPEAA